jgi:perosamine synthetase
MKNNINIYEIMERLEAVLSPYPHPLMLHEPCFEGNEWEYTKQCLDSGWVSSAGKYVEKFEQHLADFTGVKQAVALVNGTAALHLSLLLAGVKAGEEVLLPALTFIATANAVSYIKAVPHFVDSSEYSLGLDSEKLSLYLQEMAHLKAQGSFNKYTGRRISALIVMHTFGHPVDLDPLLDLCEKYQMILIEDAAEALGSYYKGKHVGHGGLLSTLSFNGNKIITTGGGGAILSNDSEMAARARHLSTQAKVPHPLAFNHDQIGFNYRMPNLNAALGCAQLEQLPRFIEKKRLLAQRYQLAFSSLAGIKIFQEADYATSNYWLNVLLLDEEYSKERDRLLELTHQQGIMTRPAWTLMHKLPMYKDCPRMDLSTAESLERRIINLPSSAFLVQ